MICNVLRRGSVGSRIQVQRFKVDSKVQTTGAKLVESVVKMRFDAIGPTWQRMCEKAAGVNVVTLVKLCVNIGFFDKRRLDGFGTVRMLTAMAS